MNAATLSDTPPHRTAPLALWRVAAAFMHMLFALFGGPEDVAARHTLTRAPYRLMLSWLRVGEAMMRRLLLIEASAFAKPNTRPLLWAKRARKRRLVGFSADAPDKWRVSFRCFSSPACGGSGARRSRVTMGAASPSDRRAITSPARGGGNQFHSAWPAAERYEALLRVFNNPAPFARRLAHRLHALPHRLVEVLRTPPEAEHRVEDFAALTEAARARWRIPNTS